MRTPFATSTDQSTFLRVLALVVLGLVMYVPTAASQSIGDFRTRQSGNWGNSDTWDEYTGSGWSNTGSKPDEGDGVITIRSGHTVTGDAGGNIDQLVIQAGSRLDYTQDIRVKDGTGTDVDVYGTLTLANTKFELQDASTVVMHAGSITTIGAGSEIRMKKTTTLTFQNGATATNNGIIQPEDDARFHVNSGSYVTNNGSLILKDNSQISVNNGTFHTKTSFQNNNNSTNVFTNGGIYIHDLNGGAFPEVSRTTWGTNSEARIIGITNSLPTELNTSFYHFTWNNPGQTADLGLAGTINAIQGNLKVNSTGTKSLTWNASGSNLTVGADFIQTGGEFRFTNTGSNTMTVAGSFNQTGGTTRLTNTSGTPALLVAKNFTVNGTLTKAGAGFSTVTLNGATSQLITQNGVITGNIDVVMSGAGQKTLATNMTVPAALTLTSGGLNLSTNNLNVAGHLTINATLSNSGPGFSTVTLNGSSPQTLTSTTALVGNINLSTSGTGLKTLANNLTVPGTVSVNGAGLNIAAKNLTLTGNLTVSTTMNNPGPGTSTLSLTGSTAQAISVPGALTGSIDLVVSGAGQKTLSTNLTVPGHVTETSGGFNMATKTLSLSGNLNVTSTLTNAGQIVFTGSSAKTLTLPSGSRTLPDLVIDSASGSLALQNDLTISSYLIVRAGTMNVNGKNLVLSSGAVLHNTGTFTGNLTMSRNYSWNDDGWRMIASPLSGVMYSSLNSAFWTQGGTWATNATGSPNLHSFTFPTQNWSGITGGDAALGAGGAYILYVYKNDNLGNSILPTTWTVTGGLQTTNSFSLTYTGVPASSFSYIGNPLATNIDWNASFAASNAISSSYATWDPSLTTGGGITGYKYYDASSGIGQAGRYIPPFTGFMVGATGALANLVTATSEAASRQTASYFGKGNEVAPHFQLQVEGEGLAEDEFYLSFGPEATDSSNAFDVTRLAPLALDFATIWSNDDNRRLAFDGRDMLEGSEVYDISFATTRPGLYQVSLLKSHNIPENWSAKAFDLETGQEYDLEASPTITFQTRTSDLVTLKRPLDSNRSPRFRVVVEDADLAGNNTAGLLGKTDEVVLSQNYPNPFNPTTSIRFTIPTASAVRLDVYDALGRRVESPLNRHLEAGWHEIMWSASDYSSGLYFYRLTYGAQTLTRSMLLLR